MPGCSLLDAMRRKSVSCVNIIALCVVATLICCSSVKPSLPISLAENTSTPRLFRPSTMAMLTLSSA